MHLLRIMKELIALEEAIKLNNKSKILKCYTWLQDEDWELISDQTFNIYEKLIDQANEVLET